MDWFVKTPKRGKRVMWIHPVTGDYKVPMRDDVPMPERYKMLGYETKVFDSYFEHMRWMKSKGLISHETEDIPIDRDVLGTRDRFGN